MKILLQALRVTPFFLYALLIAGIFSFQGAHPKSKEADMKAIYQEIHDLKDGGQLQRAYHLAQSLVSQASFARDEDEYLKALSEEIREDIYTNGYKQLLFDESFLARKHLKDLLKGLGYDGSDDINSINTFMQGHFLRTKERWETPEIHQGAFLEGNVHHFLDEIGLMADVIPLDKSYDVAIVYGALFYNFAIRLQYLFDLWDKGVRFKEIVFLGGKRDLDTLLESPSRLKEMILKKAYLKGLELTPQDFDNYPKNEHEMMIWIWNIHSKAKSMANEVKVTFVNTPQSLGSQGIYVRPTTDDTVNYWLKMHNPKPARYLLISNDIFIPRQDLVARKILPKNFMINTVGPSSNHYDTVTCILDELTRLIYQSKLVLNSQ